MQLMNQIHDVITTMLTALVFVGKNYSEVYDAVVLWVWIYIAELHIDTKNMQHNAAWTASSLVMLQLSCLVAFQSYRSYYCQLSVDRVGIEMCKVWQDW